MKYRGTNIVRRLKRRKRLKPYLRCTGPAKEELILDVRYQMWMETVKKYWEKETKEGVQQSDQLDRTQSLAW